MHIAYTMALDRDDDMKFTRAAPATQTRSYLRLWEPELQKEDPEMGSPPSRRILQARVAPPLADRVCSSVIVIVAVLLASCSNRRADFHGACRTSAAASARTCWPSCRPTARSCRGSGRATATARSGAAIAAASA